VPEANAYVAGHFVLSLKAVRNRVSAVLVKLGVSTRTEAEVKARQARLGGQTDWPGPSA
jgi:DNA-binding NarL/FixJ family response regulator